MKPPKKNSIISKMIRYPFWFIGKVNWYDEFELPKTSCGYGFMGIALGLFNIAILTNLLFMLHPLIILTNNVWLHEVLGFTGKLSTLHLDLILDMFFVEMGACTLFTVAGLFVGLLGGLSIIPAICLAATVWTMVKIENRYSYTSVDWLIKGVKWIYKTTLVVNMINLTGNTLKPLVTSLTSLYKKIHQKLCVPMEYKDE